MSIMGLLIIKTSAGTFFPRQVPENTGCPGIKTILIAMAWGIVTAVLPSLSVSKHMGLSAVLVFLWSTSLVFARTAFFDILDMQGDRIVGKETLPILMGEKRALRLLKIILIINVGMLLVSGTFHFISTLGFALAICPVLFYCPIRP